MITKLIFLALGLAMVAGSFAGRYERDPEETKAYVVDRILLGLTALALMFFFSLRTGWLWR